MGFTALLYAVLCDTIRPADIGNRLLISQEPQITSLEPQIALDAKKLGKRDETAGRVVGGALIGSSGCELVFEPNGASILAQG